MLVLFTYKNGRKVPMQKRYAKILQDLKHGSYAELGDEKPTADAPPTPPVISIEKPVQTEAQAPAAPEEKTQLVSVAAKKLAEEYKVDLSLVTGTGANGQITKTDVESYIDDLVV